MRRAVLLLALTLQLFLTRTIAHRGTLMPLPSFQPDIRLAATSYPARVDDSRTAALELCPQPFAYCCRSRYFHPGAPASCRSRSSPNALALFFSLIRGVFLCFSALIKTIARQLNGARVCQPKQLRGGAGDRLLHSSMITMLQIRDD